MKFELNQYTRDVSNDEISKDIAEVSKKLGKTSISKKEYIENNGKYAATTIRRRFGSWNDATEKAGLNKNEQINNSEVELLENILNVWVKLGRQPRYGEIQKPLSNLSIATYEKRFGGWRNALEKFIVWVNSEDKDILIEKPLENDFYKHKTKREPNLRLRFLVLQRDNFKCCSCGASPAKNPAVLLHIDHIKAWSNGGETVVENLETKCSDCNYGKSNLN